MKNIYLAILASALSISVIAQDATITTITTTTTTEAPVLKSRRGELILPQKDEWGLGVSASPFLEYMGNFLHGNNYNNSPDFDYASNPANNIAVFGKLMKDEHTAYRVRFNVSVNSNTNKSVSIQNELNPDPAYPSFTEDWQKYNSTAIVIAPGIEKRRGSTRLQGIYGAELVLGYNRSSIKYDYGNAMSSDFNAPITHNYGNNILGGNQNAASNRVTNYKSGSNFLVGARGFVGVEYFIAPRISLGGEFGYMLGFNTQAKAVTTSETWDGSSQATRAVKTDSYINGGVSSIGIGLDHLNGTINLLFYF